VPPQKSSFLDKVLGRINRLDPEGLQTVVQRLARERSFLEMLFNTIEDGVLVVDEEGRVLYFNQAVTRLLGLQDPASEGQPIMRILPELDWNKIYRMDKQGGQRVSRHEFEVTYPRPRFLSLFVAPLDGEATGSTGLALIIHDATEAREKTFAAIESERIQALTLLAASVAHEIGNPLNALSIHLQLMEREIRKLTSAHPRAAGSIPGRPRGRTRETIEVDVDSDTRHVLKRLEKFLEVAKGETARLDYIITQFLQAIRPVPPQLKMVSLNQVVQETLELLRPEIENRGLMIKEELSVGLPVVPIDPVQIQQALVNLIKNALHAMSQGGVLTLETGQTDEEVWVSVTDTGGGIPQEKINRIFEPFFTTKKKGTGLGLMIVQRIVREHGGRIELESRVRQGTTFRVWIPRQERRPRLLGAASKESRG
jgi:PAS domain S-box-containing protein